MGSQCKNNNTKTHSVPGHVTRMDLCMQNNEVGFT